MLCPANMLGVICAIRLAQTGRRHPERSFARFWFPRGFCGRETQPKDLSSISTVPRRTHTARPCFSVFVFLFNFFV
jgi:hypothetical protein